MTTSNTLQYVTSRKAIHLESSLSYMVDAGPFFDDVERTLPAGQYISLYQDAGGIYFEAPNSSDPDSRFVGVDRGGIYVKNGAPRRAFVYLQDSRVSYTYTAYGAMQSGGSGMFKILEELPPRVVRSFQFQDYKQDY